MNDFPERNVEALADFAKRWQRSELSFYDVIESSAADAYPVAEVSYALNFAELGGGLLERGGVVVEFHRVHGIKIIHCSMKFYK